MNKQEIEFESFEDLLSEMNDELWLEMLNEFVDMQYVNEMIIESFYEREEAEQKEILTRYSAIVNKKLKEMEIK